MNVYKIIDEETPYSGGMALIAANNEKEAIEIFENNTRYCKDNIIYELNSYTAIILENITYNKEEPCFITENWYYE